MPAQYVCWAGCGAITPSVQFEAQFLFWNPSSTIPVFVKRIISQRITASTAQPKLAWTRASTAGVGPQFTYTPTAANHLEGTTAPPSGVVLYSGGWSTTKPTLDTTAPFPLLMFWTGVAGLIGHGVEYAFPKPFKVLPGTGLAFIEIDFLNITQGGFVVFWEE